MSDALAHALAERTLELCRIRSVIGAERALADHLEAWARSRFPPDQVLRRSHSLLVGSLDDPRPTIALAGHLDTVPGKDVSPRLEGGRLFGLGASDMKGGVAVMMALAERLPRPSLPFNLLLVLYEREEGPYLESGLGPLLELLTDPKRISLAIAMEPTDNAVQVGCMGTLHATLTFRGKSAHSARPWQGENAIHQAGPLLAALAARPPHDVDFFGFTFREVMSVTRAEGGKARNVVPDQFSLNLNYRFAPGKAPRVAMQEVRELAQGAEVAFTDVAPSGRVCLDNPLAQRLLALSGRPAEAKQAWTDVGRLSEAGIDAVNFGPGEAAQAHQADESAPVAALPRSYEVLAALLSGR